MISDIKPLILTLDEAANISRVLDGVSWAKDVVVVDSGSRDATLDIISRYPNVRVFERAFDTHANQWNFALEQTGIESEWVLALDADHVMTEELIAEIARLAPDPNISGFRVAFTYCALGRPLRASLYPPLISIYRRGCARYIQQGHTQRLTIDGTVATLDAHMLHDDRKPFARWFRSQDRYMRLEADLIKESSWSELSWSNRLRMFILPGPPMAFLWCLLVKRTILDGLPGIYYSLQRMVAESILSFHLIARLPR